MKSTDLQKWQVRFHKTLQTTPYSYVMQLYAYNYELIIVKTVFYSVVENKKEMQPYVKTAYPCWYSIGESNTEESVPKPLQEGGWETYPGEERADGRSPVRTSRL